MTIKRKINNKYGVTLIELIVTIVIISVVCVAATAGISYAKRVSYVNSVREQLATLSNGISEIIFTELKNVNFNGEKGNGTAEDNAKVANIVPTINRYLENNSLGVNNITYQGQNFVETNAQNTAYDYQFICNFKQSIDIGEGDGALYYTAVTVRLLNRFNANGELITNDKYVVALEQTFYIPEPVSEDGESLEG